MLLLITLFFSFLTITPHEVAAANPTFITGSKTFEITDYDFLDEVFKPDECIRSEPFTVGGYQWVIDVYPRGLGYPDYVSLKVRLINTTDTVSARATQRLMDWTTSKWSTNTPVWKDTETKSAPGDWGFQRFITRSDLKASSYLKDGVLLIKATIWVLDKSNITAAAGISFDKSKSQAQA